MTSTAQTPEEVAAILVGFEELFRVQPVAELSANLIAYVSGPPEPPVVTVLITAVYGAPT